MGPCPKKTIQQIHMLSLLNGITMMTTRQLGSYGSVNRRNGAKHSLFYFSLWNSVGFTVWRLTRTQIMHQISLSAYNISENMIFELQVFWNRTDLLISFITLQYFCNQLLIFFNCINPDCIRIVRSEISENSENLKPRFCFCLHKCYHLQRGFAP
jgi:hypothetical protein